MQQIEKVIKINLYRVKKRFRIASIISILISVEAEKNLATLVSSITLLGHKIKLTILRTS